MSTTVPYWSNMHTLILPGRAARLAMDVSSHGSGLTGPPGGLVPGGNSGVHVAVMVPPARDNTRILVWMCVLIAVNQLGFGSVVPVLPLYARSFGASQAAIGLAI